MSGVEPEQDADEFSRDAQSLAERYRAAATEEPDAALDAGILAAARREAGARPGGPGGRGNLPVFGWRKVWASAAVLVLAVSVTLVLQRREPEPRATGAGTGDARSAPPEAAPPAPAASLQVAPAAEDVQATAAAGREAGAGPETAEQLIERIRAARAAGRLEEAAALLETLKRDFPDHPLPEDLR